MAGKAGSRKSMLIAGVLRSSGIYKKSDQFDSVGTCVIEKTVIVINISPKINQDFLEIIGL